MGSSSKRHDKIDLKKHLKTTAVYFSVQDKVDLKKHVKATTAVYFSVQNKVYLKNREDYSGLLFRTAVRFVWRIAPKHLMTMTADQLLVDLGCHCVLGVRGLVNHLHLPFGCFPYTPLLRRGAVLTRQEHDLTALLGNSFGERVARTTTNSLVFCGAEV